MKTVHTLTNWYNFCYTLGMKTAISIPDNIYQSAEKLAARLGQSRSQLYANAVRNYVEQRQAENITERLNEVYATEDSSMDPVMLSLQTESELENSPW
jgi:metal-responsive CopG/Arc/MetJ family transcriptional regulator